MEEKSLIKIAEDKNSILLLKCWGKFNGKKGCYDHAKKT